MKNLLIQSRVVSDPIKNPLAGWWLEYYFFYVKHRDLADSSAFQSMMLDASWTASGAGVTTSSADVTRYFAGNGINWTKKCEDVVVDWYFRDQGKSHTDYTLTFNSISQPVCSIGDTKWLENARLVSQAEAHDIDVVDQTGGTLAADVYASDIDRALRQWELLKYQNLTTQTYEEFLQTYGVRMPPAESINRPELIRFIREWTYPTNTIDPTNGTPRSAVSWAIAERADKDRFFKEPGFIFGLTTCRPKIYLRNQIGSAAWFLDNGYHWLPAVMRDETETSLYQLDNSVVSPLTVLTSDLEFDVRDIFLHGDQFVNFTMADDTSDQSFPWPLAAFTDNGYPTTKTDVDNFFIDDDAGDSGAANIKHDGVVSLQIATSVQEPFDLGSGGVLGIP